jgi:hypothetical protein
MPPSGIFEQSLSYPICSPNISSVPRDSQFLVLSLDVIENMAGKDVLS